jgi:putative Ca2+/H+ antiporter (TMEM165/GDT1 family)
MICLLASAIGAFGGRWWMLIVGMTPRVTGGALIFAVTLTTLVCAALAAVLGAQMAAQMRGPGMLLFLALSILSAGAGLCWPAKAAGDKALAGAKGAVSATILLLAALIGDSGPFIILAAAARTGSPLLAGFGGAAGLGAAAMAAMMLPPGALSLTTIQRIRWVAGIALLLIGLITALSAMGRL